MKKNKRLLLSLIALSASTMSYTKSTDKIKAEVSFGVDSHFGADSVERVSRMLKPSINLIFGKEVEDYDENKNSKVSPQAQSLPTKSKYYKPPYPQYRDEELAIRYISKEFKFRKRLGIKLSEDYFGFRVGLDLIGKDNNYENFIEKNEIDKLKLTVSSENKYLNGTVKYYVIGNEEKKYGIDKISEEKEKIDNKVVDYNVTFNPLVDYPVQAFVNVKGQGKRAEVSPFLGLAYKGFYVSAAPVFSINRENVNINDEIEKVTFAAPGYNKIEYFKKWAKKEADLSTKEKYFLDRADLENALVSGYKGTHRLLGHYSGSLFGDSPVKLAVNTLLDEIYDNSDFPLISDLLKKVESGISFWDYFGLGFKYGPKVEQIKAEAQNHEAINKVLSNVTSKLLDRVGLGYNRKTSHLGLIKQIPDDFKQLFPGLPGFDLFKINQNIFDPDYLYFNGFKYDDPNIPEIPNGVKALSLSAANAPQTLSVAHKDYILKRRWHFLGPDLLQYGLKDIEDYYHFRGTLKTLTELSLWDKIRSINLIKETVDKTTQLLKNPYEMVGIDITRAIYFHASEKEKNTFALEKTINKVQKELDEIKDITQTNNIAAQVNTGYVGNGYRLDLYSRINDRTHITSKDKLDFTKVQHTAGFSIQGGYKGFVAKTGLDATYTDVNLKYTNAEKKETVLKYNDINLVTQTYLGYKIKAGSKFDIDLGLTHYGEYGYIMPKTFTIGGTEHKLYVVKRDKDGRPIDLDGKPVDVEKTTEKKLVDQAFNNKDKVKGKEKENSKRKFNADDALQKEEKPLEDTWRSIYNIIAPKVGVTYRPYENFEIYNELQVPVAFNRDEFSGINLMYRGEFRYLLGNSDFDIFGNTKNIFSLRTKGKVDAGVELIQRNGVYANYDIFADLSAAKLSVYGKNLNPNIELSINPVIVSLPLKPRVIIAKENKDVYLKYGIELIPSKDTSVVAGVQKQINKDTDILEKNVKSNVREVIQYRNVGDELKAFDYKFKDLKFDKPLVYTHTPFVKIEKITDNLTLRTGFSSKYGENTYTTETKEIVVPYHRKQSDLVAMGDSHSGKEITWQYQNNARYIGGGPWVYFVAIKKYEDHIKTQSTKTLKEKQYRAYFDLDYDKEQGFNSKFNFNLEYNNVTYNESIKVLEHIEKIKKDIYAIKVNNRDKYTNKNIIEQLDDDNNIIKPGTDENVKKQIDDQLKSKNSYSLNDSNKQKIIDEMKKTIHDNTVKGTTLPNNNLGYSSVILNTYTHLGYRFKIIPQFFIGIGVNHSLDLKYVTMNNLYIGDLRLFGSSVLKVNNTISPEISTKYNIVKGLSWTSSVNVPVSFENLKYKEANVNVKTGIEFRW